MIYTTAGRLPENLRNINDRISWVKLICEKVEELDQELSCRFFVLILFFPQTFFTINHVKELFRIQIFDVLSIDYVDFVLHLSQVLS